MQWPKNPSSVGLVGNNPVSSAEVEIELDKILVENTSYEYRIEAQDSSGAYQKSDPSDVITLVDNPIARVSGDSRNAPSNKGQATIEWERIAGSDEYSIEYRRLGRTQKGGYHHSDVNWELNSYTYSSPNRIPTVVNVVDSSPSASGRMTHTITGLDLGEVYAVRLNYRTAAGWAHSARDAFVWPSASFPACGKRVATYPFFGHHASKEYSYRICEDTFPKDTRDAWENLIEHAFEQWEEATDGLVKMTPVDEDCTDLSPLEAYTAHRRPALARQQQSAKDEDARTSEVRMLNVPAKHLLTVSFPEMKSDMFKRCLYGAAACATSRNDYSNSNRQAGNELSGVDVTFSQRSFEDSPGNVDLSDGKKPKYPRVPDKVSLNTCFLGSSRIDYDTYPNRGTYAYATALHEAGHALGLSDVDST